MKMKVKLLKQVDCLPPDTIGTINELGFFKPENRRICAGSSFSAFPIELGDFELIEFSDEELATACELCDTLLDD
jgi:hypothetical protein